jgi:anti-sigma factor RsiW
MSEQPESPPPALERLLGPEAEITCEECFDLIDEYVDQELGGVDADARIPGLKAHLEGCPACREEHASLLALADVDRTDH